LRPAAGSRPSLPLGAALCLLLAHAPAYAALRSPQVPVQGSSLQAYLNGVGESIDVRQDQQSIQVLQPTVSNTAPFVLQLEIVLKDSQLELGLYDATQSGPVLLPLFSADSRPGWFAVVSFRFSPTRLVVNTFDQTSTFLGTHTFPGGNRYAIAFYEQGPDGTFYSEDSRNPGAAPQALMYAGTGLRVGSWWMAFERTSLGAGSDFDFDDAVVLIENVNVDPVQRASWGQVKARFR
jgi:hypothetical protein